MEPIHDGECIEDGASMYDNYVVYNIRNCMNNLYI